MIRGFAVLALSLCPQVMAWSAQPTQPSTIRPQTATEEFPFATHSGQPLPKNTIVICSDQPVWALTNVTKLVDQKFGEAEFAVVDGRTGPILTDATMVYFGKEFSVSLEDPCLSRYPRLKSAVTDKLLEPSFTTGHQLCGPACPPYIDAEQEYPTLSSYAYTYVGSPSQIDTYVSFCSEAFCRVGQLLGLFQLEPVLAPQRD